MFILHLVQMADKEGSVQFRICLQHKPTAESKRDWWLEADSSDSREKWFAALLYASGNAIVASEVLGDLVRRANNPTPVLAPPVYKSEDAGSSSGQAARPYSGSIRNIERFRPQDVTFEEKLGGSDIGTEVWRGTWNGRAVAVKKLNDSVMQNTFFQEATTIMLIPEHKNVVKGLGVCHEVGNMMIVQEYVSGVSLKKKIEHLLPDLIDINEVLRLLLGIAQGMAFLAQEGVIHRGLRSGNVIVSTDGTPKICDFGYSRIRSSDPGKSTDYQTTRKVPMNNSIKWMSPENISEGLFSEKSDVWSWGVTAIEMLLGRPPYGSVPAHTLPDMLRSGLASPIIEIPTTRTPEWLTNLLRACFSQNPASRPSFADIVKVMDEGINSLRSASVSRPLAQSSPSQQRPQSSIVSPVASSAVGNQPGMRGSQPMPAVQVRASTPPRIQPKVLTGDAFPPTEPATPAAPADLSDTLADISKISI
eukprot:TRINITY_DN1384_c0_g2_i1.p1 TRINITY_DN1384_c0_g2~~TRINITY_DN1384_c0_g2_i1.p1  ORF type:complete len:476 (-),score=88.04 TRINITY_DN1384_c0_g2_i1:84-1511(-)